MALRNNNVRVDSRHPQAQGICDRCGWTYNLTDLVDQKEWAGATVRNTKLKVCPSCLDEPNQQLRTYSPGPDPVPVKDPRFENADID